MKRRDFLVRLCVVSFSTLPTLSLAGNSEEFTHELFGNVLILDAKTQMLPKEHIFHIPCGDCNGYFDRILVTHNGVPIKEYPSRITKTWDLSLDIKIKYGGQNDEA